MVHVETPSNGEQGLGTTFEQFAAQALDVSSALDPELSNEPVDNLQLITAAGGGEQQPLAPLQAGGSTDSGVEMAESTGTRSDSVNTGKQAFVEASIDKEQDVADENEQKADKQMEQEVALVPATVDAEQPAEHNIAGRAVDDTVDSQEIKQERTNTTADLPQFEAMADQTVQETTETQPPTAPRSEQTPSANDPPSLSSASSPLSCADSPEPVAIPDIPALEPVMRQSSRNTKPVERFSTSHFEGSKLTPVSPVKVRTAPASTKKRKSLTPAEDVVAVTPSKKARTSSVTMKEKARSKTPQVQGRVSVEAVVEEDESLKLARELAGESFSLRVRKRSAGL